MIGRVEPPPLPRRCGTVADLSPADTVIVPPPQAGFDGAGIWFDAGDRGPPRRPARSGPPADDRAVVALDVEPVILGADGDPGDVLIDVAIGLGARNVLVASRHPDHAATIERFGELCDRAAPAASRACSSSSRSSSVARLARRASRS